jgi:hypothetical protein
MQNPYGKRYENDDHRQLAANRVWKEIHVVEMHPAVVDGLEA